MIAQAHAHAHVSKETVCNFKRILSAVRSFQRDGWLKPIYNFYRTIFHMPFSSNYFLLFLRFFFILYTYIFYVFFIQQFVQSFYSFFFFNNSSHAYVNLTRSTIWPRSIAFSRQRFYNSFFTLLRNLLSVNEHTSQTSCSAVSRETGRRGRLAESGHADDTRKTQRFLPPTSPIIIAPTTHLSINFFFLRTLFILINFYR